MFQTGSNPAPPARSRRSWKNGWPRPCSATRRDRRPPAPRQANAPSCPRPISRNSSTVNSPPRCSRNSSSPVVHQAPAGFIAHDPTPRPKAAGIALRHLDHRAPPRTPRSNPHRAEYKRVERHPDRHRLRRDRLGTRSFARACAPPSDRNPMAGCCRSRTDPLPRRCAGRAASPSARRTPRPDPDSSSAKPPTSLSIHSKKLAVLDQGHLHRLHQSRPPSPVRCRQKREIIHHRKWHRKRPIQFFLPNQLIAHFTPTPLSSCDELVVGNLTNRTPRCAVAAANPTASRNAPPPIASTYECRSMCSGRIPPTPSAPSRRPPSPPHRPRNTSIPRKSNSRSAK